MGSRGVKGFGVVTPGVMLEEEKAPSFCIPHGHLVGSQHPRLLGTGVRLLMLPV